MNKIFFFIPFIITICACTKIDCPIPVYTPSTYTTTLQPGVEGKDAVIDSIAPTTNLGNTTYLAIEAWTQNKQTNFRAQRSLLDFDYSSIPSGAIINKATLTLYADTTFNYSGGVVPDGHSTLSGSNSWGIYQITSPWNEQTVTWNLQPATGTMPAISLPASTSASQAYVIDVTSLVASEIANPNSYYGFYMKLDNEQYYRSVYFYSSDDSHTSLHPKLVIEYTK